MTDLPINSSNVAPAKTASKSSSSNTVKQADAQEFGNVLARQIADTNKPDKADKQPAESPKTETQSSASPTANTDKPADNVENIQAQTGAENVANLPENILASLLVLPAQAAITQTTIPQTVEQTTTASNEQVAYTPSVLAAPKLDKSTLPSNNDNMTDPFSMQETKATLPSLALEINSKVGKALDNPLKDIATKDTNTIATNLTRGSQLTELAPSAFQLPLTPTTPATQMSLATPLTQPAWGDEFNQKITWMASQRNQSAELHLNPPHLGPLDVVLKMNGDQATATFTSPHAAVREAIEQAMPRLREMLADSGIMLGNAMVSDQSAHGNQDNTPRKPSPTERSVDVSSGVVTPISTRPLNRGLVDTFA